MDPLKLRFGSKAHGPLTICCHAQCHKAVAAHIFRAVNTEEIGEVIADFPLCHEHRNDVLMVAMEDRPIWMS